MRRSPERPFVTNTILALLLPLAACSYVEDTIGHLTAQKITVVGCLDGKPLDISLNALAIDACADLLYLRAQDARTSAAAADGVVLQFTDLQQLQTELDAGPVELDVSSGRVTVALYLNNSCTDSFSSLEATSGTVTVTSLESSTGGDVRLVATVEITDMKADELATTELLIDIDTSESSFRPMRDFPFCP